MNVNIELAQEAQKDFAEARRRYYTALREALPVNTPIRFMAHNGRKYNGVIAGPCQGTGYVRIQNTHTQNVYEIAICYIDGLM